MFETIDVKQQGPVAILTIQREEKRNALDERTLEELYQGIEKIKSDSRSGILVITGAGDRAFSAGADIQAMAQMDVQQSIQFAALGHRLMNAIEGSDLVSIASINGIAFGGGLELALACDIRIASTKALFALPETKIGLVPGFGGTQRLREQIGEARALEMILSGDPISAEKALQWGIVSHIYPPGELIGQSMDLAGRIAKTAPLARSRAKNLVKAGSQMNRSIALGEESEAFCELISGEEAREGLNAFLEKREPQF